MGSYSVKSQFAFTEKQKSILAQYGVKFRTEWIPEKQECGGKTFAHHLSTFEWDGQDPPIPNSVLCYKQGDKWGDPDDLIPSQLGYSERKSETVSLTTHGLSGSKD
jgi:hypothetical protein